MAEFKDLLEKGITFIPFAPPFASPALKPQDIARWEAIVNAPFPRQYRDYLLHCNGGTMRTFPEQKFTVDAYAFAIKWPQGLSGLTPASLLSRFFVMLDTKNLPPGTPREVMTFDYNYNAWKESLPPGTFPIATDPGGNPILIGLSGEKTGKIYYWLFEFANVMETPDTAAYAYLGEIADSFVEFILSLEYIED